MKRSRGVAKRLNDGVGFLMRKNKVAVIWGEAADRGARQGHGASPPSSRQRRKVRSVPALYEAKHIIIATGARPRVLPGLEPDGKLIWTYFEAMVPERMPKSLLVIGSGAIGIEFASFYRTFGAEVTVVEVLAADLAGRGCGDRRARPQGVREARHQDHDRRQGDQAREEAPMASPRPSMMARAAQHASRRNA